jgi:uncharacterized protein YndB with AHSA1/START domain
MKLRHESLLPLPRDRVVALFTDAALRTRWQPGLRAYRAIDGVAGTPGARAELVVQLGGRPVVMIETVLEQAPPDRFVASYAAEGVMYVVHNRFSPADDGTAWILESELSLPPFLVLMGPLLAPLFRQQFDGMVAGFRELVASHVPGAHAAPDAD